MTPFVSDDGGGDYYFDDGPKFYFYRPGITTLRRCGAICILIAITVISSVLIGVYIPPSVGEEEHHLIGTVEMLGEGKVEEGLFKIAESINQHCEASKLHSAEGRWECERLCVNHLCCFDTIGDGYSCRGDESKHCVVYSGCEVLVDSDSLEDNKAQQGEDLDDSVALDGGFGDDGENYNDDFMSYYDDGESVGGSNAILYKPNGGSKVPSTTQAQQAQASVGSLSIDNYCTESMVKTVVGRRECEKLCKDHHCCFDPVPRNSCRKDPDKMCSSYASCEVLTLDIDTDLLDANNDGITTHEEITNGSHTIGEACAESKINTASGKKECEALCSSHLCCFSKSEFNCRSDPDKTCPAFAPCEILNVIAATEAGYSLQASDNDSDETPNNVIDTIELNDEQKLQIQQDLNSKCKVETSPACFNVCKDWFCCFESSDEKSCRNQTNNLCNFVEKCKVAALSSDIRVPTQQQQQQQPIAQEQDDFQAQPSSQQQQQMQQQPDDSQQSSFPPEQPTPQQQDDYYQDDYFEDEFSQSQPSVQQMQQEQSDPNFRPQPAQQQQQQQQQEQNDPKSDPNFRPQPTQQQQQQQQQEQSDPKNDPNFRPQPAQQQQQQQQQQEQSDPKNDPNFRPQPAQQQQQQLQQQQQEQSDANFRPQPAQQQQQQQQQEQSDPNFRPQPTQQQQQQEQNNFQSGQQNDFQSPIQQQPQQPLQQQQQQDDFSQPQQQQPITQQQQNGPQPLGQPAEQQQFVPQMQPQQPSEQNNLQSSVQPIPQQTQPAQQQQSNTNSVSSKPPPPPPARCIPTGDDEVHTETFTDDWNDDVYDRCRRWESKYGMKISEYLDLYGV